MLTSSVLVDAVFTCKGKSCSHVNPVWHNPCGVRNRIMARKRYFTVDNEISPDGLRHPSSRPLRRVRMQLRIAYEHLHTGQLQRDVHFVYSGVKQLIKEKFEYNWLPSRQLSWYRDSVKCLDKKSKVEVLLPSLHVALQNFSATFETLRMSRGESQLSEHQEIFGTRRNILSEISHQVKKLLCEVETAILNVGLQLPNRLSEEAAEAMIWDIRPDHTRGLIQDWGVLAAYQAFLDDWRTIVRRLVGSKSNVPCKPRNTLRHRHKLPGRRHRPFR